MTHGRALSRYLLSLGVAAGLVTAVVSPADAADAADADDTPLSYVVNTGADAADVASAERAIRDVGAVVVQSWPQIGVVIAHSAASTFKADVVGADGGDVIQSVGATRTAPLTAEESPIGVTEETTAKRATRTFEERQGVTLGERRATDPMESDQWDMTQIKADIASDGSRRVLVGVLDDGIDDSHPDLAPNVDAKNSVGCVRAGVPDQRRSAWLPTEPSLHGTHVAGTIAAARNGVGIVGVAPRSRLASVKVVNDDGFIYPEYAICGFLWAADRGMDVTNNSYFVDPWLYWCGDDEDQAAVRVAVERAVEYSERHGVVSAAAAGNSDADLAHKTIDTTSPNDTEPVARRITNECRSMPRELPGVVTVASNDSGGLKSSFSNYGYGPIDVTAPGSSILSTVPGGYMSLSGTSMSSPHAAGVLALLKAAHPTASPSELVRMIRAQADDQPCPDDDRCRGNADYNAFYGDGLVDALDATGGD